AAAPALASSRSRGGGRDPNAVLDETKSERGKKLLGQIKEILLFDINISFDSSGKITEYVSNSAERMWKQAGVDVTRRRDAPALMVVLMRFKQAGSSANAKTLEVQTMILVVDNSGPQPQKVKVWDETDELGSVSEG